MCGLVCFVGHVDGAAKVLEALYLLEYRAPDSAGLAALTGPTGALAVRRAVGVTRQLVKTMVHHPLYGPAEAAPPVAHLLRRQGLSLFPAQLRDCSPQAGFTLHHLYNGSGLCIGVGDRGAAEPARPTHSGMSPKLAQVLAETGGLPSHDFDPDPVRHAFRLVAAHAASRAALDPAWRQALDEALRARTPAGAYPHWAAAWAEEFAANTPGQAFAVAVRRFQETFPGLAAHLAATEWERVGGLTAQAMAHIVVGHGRWAMVGAVTEANAHPLLDHSRTRAVVENGSHNATLMLGVRAQQETWWRGRGLPPTKPVHRSENTTEVVAYEWERAAHQIPAGELSAAEAGFVAGLRGYGLDHPEEQALRLAMWRLRAGNTHACALYSQHNPDTLFITSHRKPVAIATRTMDDGRQEIMAASDVNAALMLWPGDEVNAAAQRIAALEQADRLAPQARQELAALLARFTVSVIFLDADTHQGEELLACIRYTVQEGRVMPAVQVSRYDGAPVTVTPFLVQLNPVMTARQGFTTYTERHLAEIPAILDNLRQMYVSNGQVQLADRWENGQLQQPGLNLDRLHSHFGSALERLTRLLLIGEGSSWRDAQAAAPLLRELLPEVQVSIFRPVELLNLGPVLNPAGDLAVEISWSGTTDSLLKVDDLLAELGVLRLAITGRPHSDLGRRAAASAGILDICSGIEVSVATVKGFEAILAVLNLLALQLAHLRPGAPALPLAALTAELTETVPQHVRAIIEDPSRRVQLRQVAARCGNFNKVAVVGGSPIDAEGELKIEELAQVVAANFAPDDASLRGLLERSAAAATDRQRTLYIINATTPARQQAVQPILNYLHATDQFCLIHTTPHPALARWQAMPNAAVFVSPGVSPFLQPLVDAPFFFDLAVALAYGRGLPPEEIDRPRNLAKSVTTTAAERRAHLETRQEFFLVPLADFGRNTAARPQPPAWLRGALAGAAEPLPALPELPGHRPVVVLAQGEAAENAALMAASAWQEILGIELTISRQAFGDPPVPVDLRVEQAGAAAGLVYPHTVALPADVPAIKVELGGALYLMGLAVRLAHQQGQNTGSWEAGLAALAALVDEMLAENSLAGPVEAVLAQYAAAGYDKAQIIGGGQDFVAARGMARSLRSRGIMAEALYTDSAWHGPLAAVGGPDANHDTLIIILATDPLFQATALVDTQVYRTRNAPVILVVPAGNEDLPAVRGVDPLVVAAIPAAPRPFGPLVAAAWGELLARRLGRLIAVT